VGFLGSEGGGAGAGMVAGAKRGLRTLARLLSVGLPFDVILNLLLYVCLFPNSLNRTDGSRRRMAVGGVEV